MKKIIAIVSLFIFIIIISNIFSQTTNTTMEKLIIKPGKNRVLKDVISQLEKEKYDEVKELFIMEDLSFPTDSLRFLAFKSERSVEMWAKEKDGKYSFIKEYKLTAISGNYGPKLKQGDRQIPEGIYETELFNPNSSYHLSIRLNYPNAFDKEMAKEDERTDLGDDIYVHGSNVTIGCLAMGNKNIEEIFYIVSKFGLKNTKFLIFPNDYRKDGTFLIPENAPNWLPKLHEQLRDELLKYRK